MALFGRKKSKTDDKEIKDIINKNIASSMRTQQSFANLLKLNGCSTLKLGSVGSKIRKQLLNEVKNGDLTAETVMPRAYDLIGEFLGIDSVKTFEDMAVENNSFTIKNNKPLYCGNCGNLIQEDSKFCPKCGFRLISDSIKCSKCGEINEFGSKFCVNCGNNLKQTKKEVNKQNIENKKSESKNKVGLNITTNSMASEVKRYIDVLQSGDKDEIMKLKPFPRKMDIGIGKVDTSELADEMDEIVEAYKSDDPMAIPLLRVKQKQRKIEKENKPKTITDKIKEKEQKANNLKNNGQIEEAIKLYEENIATGEYCYNSYTSLYFIYDQQREYEKAEDVLLRQLTKCKEVDCNDYDYILDKLKYTKSNSALSRITDNNLKIKELEEQGLFDDTIPLYQSNLNERDEYEDYIMPYYVFGLANVYHRKRDFEKEYEVLKDGYERTKNFDILKSLENVEQYLNTGKWKYDCLPADPKPIYYQVKEAKTLLKSEDKEKGIEMLENLMDEGSYNNTVYYSLYQTYKKDKKYDDCIRVCDKAIENLGLFSQDRLSKWNEYKNKIISKQK